MIVGDSSRMALIQVMRAGWRLVLRAECTALVPPFQPMALHSTQLDDLVVMSDFDARTPEHDRGRAVLLGRQFDRALDLGFLQAAPLHHETQMDPGEHLGVFGRTL